MGQIWAWCLNEWHWRERASAVLVASSKIFDMCGGMIVTRLKRARWDDKRRGGRPGDRERRTVDRAFILNPMDGAEPSMLRLNAFPLENLT